MKERGSLLKAVTVFAVRWLARGDWFALAAAATGAGHLGEETAHTVNPSRSKAPPRPTQSVARRCRALISEASSRCLIAAWRLNHRADYSSFLPCSSLCCNKRKSSHATFSCRELDDTGVARVEVVAEAVVVGVG